MNFSRNDQQIGYRTTTNTNNNNMSHFVKKRDQSEPKSIDLPSYTMKTVKRLNDASLHKQIIMKKRL